MIENKPLSSCFSLPEHRLFALKFLHSFGKLKLHILKIVTTFPFGLQIFVVRIFYRAGSDFKPIKIVTAFLLRF